MNNDFVSFRKIPRLSREIVITEKIDGTNGQIFITDDGKMFVSSRNRWITPEDDNAGFAAWCRDNREELFHLGPGHHFGEWWGHKIGRGYGLKERRFSLFNVHRWEESRPACCHVVPVLFRGPFTTDAVDTVLSLLAAGGSVAAPGYENPEGVVVFHVPSGYMFKKTVKNDDVPKGTLCTKQR